MRFTSIIAAGLFAVAVKAQTDVVTTGADPTTAAEVTTTGAGTDTEVIATTAPGTSTEAAVPTTGTAVPEAPTTTGSVSSPQDPAQAAILACLEACNVSDVNCKASCIAVPSPNNQNVNATTDCVANCPQGNGTAADNLEYANCVSGCIGRFFFTTTGTPNLQTTGTLVPSVTQIQTTITSDGSTFVTSFSSTVPPSGSPSDDAQSEAPSSTSLGAADTRFGPVGSGIGFLSFLAAILAL
ncbi:hypothetical protein GGS23DRAFT_594569 [Durotheca rogersii]|uniref:uncharacterized protein n=1 Tax=Durotheca rogersii TaxID=419775 RepID=UPI002220DD3D|nr:uncharacterized protein GGS23DRAFT_594569 [Durotheca rogersii]KAI5865010.1 hypothetical protein GGS23DRAFT_594569 [Durotheca rogersii]